ncbi:hypothetical protein ACVIGB_003406 [Bradyrhizobium sp. USDA 4341]
MTDLKHRGRIKIDIAEQGIVTARPGDQQDENVTFTFRSEPPVCGW